MPRIRVPLASPTAHLAMSTCTGQSCIALEAQQAESDTLLAPFACGCRARVLVTTWSLA